MTRHQRRRRRSKDVYRPQRQARMFGREARRVSGLTVPGDIFRAISAMAGYGGIGAAEIYTRLHIG